MSAIITYLYSMLLHICLLFNINAFLCLSVCLSLSLSLMAYLIPNSLFMGVFFL